MKVTLYLNRYGPKIEICLGLPLKMDGWEEIVHEVATLVEMMQLYSKRSA
jgi:hypothetical protein